MFNATAIATAIAGGHIALDGLAYRRLAINFSG